MKDSACFCLTEGVCVCVSALRVRV